MAPELCGCVTEARTLAVFCCCSSHLRRVLSAQVSEARLTVMVLRDDRRTVVDVAWPSPCNVTLESRAGRLHQKVGVSQLSTGKWRSCIRGVLQIGGSLSRTGDACVRYGTVTVLSAARHAGRRGQVALDARHKEFPLFVQRLPRATIWLFSPPGSYF